MNVRTVAILASAVVVATVGCMRSPGTPETIHLSPPGSRVLVATVPPPSPCELVGDIYGRFASSDLMQAVIGARIDLRNKAAERGATHVVLETTDDASSYGSTDVVIAGKALRCGGNWAAPPAPTPPGPPMPTSPSPVPPPSPRPAPPPAASGPFPAPGTFGAPQFTPPPAGAVSH